MQSVFGSVLYFDLYPRCLALRQGSNTLKLNRFLQDIYGPFNAMINGCQDIDILKNIPQKSHFDRTLMINALKSCGEKAVPSRHMKTK